MTKVELSRSARRYFLQETAYLRQRSRPAAEVFRTRISKALDTLASFPRAGFSHDGLPVPDISRMVVGNYILDYQTEKERVLILSIRHGRQAPLAELAEDFSYEAPDGTP